MEEGFAKLCCSGDNWLRSGSGVTSSASSSMVGVGPSKGEGLDKPLWVLDPGYASSLNGLPTLRGLLCGLRSGELVPRVW